MLKRKKFSSLSDVKGTVIVRKQGGHRLKLLTHLPNNIFFGNNLERMQDSQNAYFSALTIQISSRLGCWHSIHLAISYPCIVVCGF